MTCLWERGKERRKERGEERVKERGKERRKERGKERVKERGEERGKEGERGALYIVHVTGNMHMLQETTCTCSTS